MVTTELHLHCLNLNKSDICTKSTDDKISQDIQQIPQPIDKSVILEIMRPSMKWFTNSLYILLNLGGNITKRPPPIILPTLTQNRILFLDLDQTLISHQLSQKFTTQEKMGEVQYTQHYKIPFIPRPNITIFLQEMSKYFELWVFTAADTEYAKEIIQEIDPFSKIKGALTKENCYCLHNENGNNHWIKDLKILNNQEKSEIIILDDSIHAWPADLENLIPAIPYFGDSSDNFLENISPLLVFLSSPSVHIQTILADMFNIRTTLSYLAEYAKHHPITVK